MVNRFREPKSLGATKMDIKKLNKTIGHTLSNYQIAIDRKLSSSTVYALKLAIRELNRAKSELKQGKENAAIISVLMARNVLRFAANTSHI